MHRLGGITDGVGGAPSLIVLIGVGVSMATPGPRGGPRSGSFWGQGSPSNTICDASLHFANKMYNTIPYVLQYQNVKTLSFLKRLKVRLLGRGTLSLMLPTRIMISQRLTKRHKYLARVHICESLLCSCRLLCCIHDLDCDLCHIVFSCKFLSVSFYFSTYKTWDFVKLS